MASSDLGELACGLRPSAWTKDTWVVLNQDQHMWAWAVELEHKYGDCGSLVAAHRIDTLDAEGDEEGAGVWRSILWRLEALGKRDGPAQ